MTPRPWSVVAVPIAVGAVAAVLAGCGIPVDRAVEALPGPTRTHWELSHRVPESASVRVVGQRMDAYAESTTVSLGHDASGADVICSVSVAAPGWGGPENRVGEQLPTTVQGRPALRNGAGAEGDYLMWQRADGAWLESICEGDGQSAFQDRLAELVTDEPSDVLLPFDPSPLPAGLDVSSVEVGLRPGETKVYLGAPPGVGRRSGDGLVLSFDAELEQQQGRATVIAGHPATVDETPRFPGLCLTVQGHDVCVGTDASDTGPYPDRSGELSVMIALAGSLRFPADLDDRSSWYPAQDVVG